MLVGAVADLHGWFPGFQTEMDVLCIAGDIAPDFPFSMTQFDPDICRMLQMEWLARDYADWERQVPAKRIIVTPGNHDWWVRMPENCRSEVLIDESVTIDGKTFYGTPWVAPCGDWNFQLDRGQRKARFADIPAGLDVLITHMPAHKCLDRTWGGDDAGCPELRHAIYQKKPRHVFFGHIHEGWRHKGVDAKLGVSAMHHVTVRAKENPRVFVLD